jgi:hypothetical protein
MRCQDLVLARAHARGLRVLRHGERDGFAFRRQLKIPDIEVRIDSFKPNMSGTGRTIFTNPGDFEAGFTMLALNFYYVSEFKLGGDAAYANAANGNIEGMRQEVERSPAGVAPGSPHRQNHFDPFFYSSEHTNRQIESECGLIITTGKLFAN